ncbi:calcineurin B-like protein 4 [Tanacetum coccineum]|uniref:Calcineurin B-like protein 4 n=1 Tax=Tanacetum coccineum TaxID=301880 RepID=A0ABQ5EWU2_9ASTR
MKANGTIDKHKERLAIIGFRQQEGLYYFDTYSTRITSVKMILAIIALRNGEVHQMDVKRTFLNGDLEIVLYMNQPEGFMAHRLESKVCMLVKSLYGLRKAPKQGHQFSPYLNLDPPERKADVLMLSEKLCRRNLKNEITYMREKWGRFKGNYGGRKFLRALAEPGCPYRCVAKMGEASKIRLRDSTLRGLGHGVTKDAMTETYLAAWAIEGRAFMSDLVIHTRGQAGQIRDIPLTAEVIPTESITTLGNVPKWKIIPAARKNRMAIQSINGYKGLKAAFLAYFMQQKKYVKDPVEIHNIKQREGETIEDFMECFKVETGHMKGAPECMGSPGSCMG